MNTNYIAILKSDSYTVKTKFFSLNIEENCIIIGNTYICNRNNAFRDDANQLKCIIAVYENNTFPEACAIHTTNAVESWIPVSKGLWAFTIPTFSMLDDGLNITGSGLLTTGNSSVSVRNNSLVITDENKFINIISPNFNLTTMLEERAQAHTLQFNPGVQSHILHLKEKIEEIKEKAKETAINIHDAHHYVAPYLLIIVILIGYCIQRGRNNQPTAIDHDKYFQRPYNINHL